MDYDFVEYGIIIFCYHLSDPYQELITPFKICDNIILEDNSQGHF